MLIASYVLKWYCGKVFLAKNTHSSVVKCVCSQQEFGYVVNVLVPEIVIHHIMEVLAVTHDEVHLLQTIKHNT